MIEGQIDALLAAAARRFVRLLRCACRWTAILETFSRPKVPKFTLQRQHHRLNAAHADCPGGVLRAEEAAALSREATALYSPSHTWLTRSHPTSRVTPSLFRFLSEYADSVSAPSSGISHRCLAG